MQSAWALPAWTSVQTTAVHSQALQQDSLLTCAETAVIGKLAAAINELIATVFIARMRTRSSSACAAVRANSKNLRIGCGKDGAGRGWRDRGR